jgi:hypothetical protein
MTSPFAAIIDGWITQAVFKAIVPVPVIVPPVNPVPATTEVTVPVHCVIVAHLRPEAQVESADRNWPSVPTPRAVGVDAAVPVIKAPLPVTQVFGRYAEAAAAGVRAVVVSVPA